MAERKKYICGWQKLGNETSTQKECTSDALVDIEKVCFIQMKCVFMELLTKRYEREQHRYFVIFLLIGYFAKVIKLKAMVRETN